MHVLYPLSLIVLLLAGCAAPGQPIVKQERVVLIPDRGDRLGALVVRTAQGQTFIDRPYGTLDVGPQGQNDVKTVSAADVERQFGPALAAQPMRPASFILYFLLGREELTPESRPLLDLIKAELLKRPAPEITVIGHTDKIGTDAMNVLLSLKRADVVRQALIQAGIASDCIETAGRGKQAPLVPTEDGVAEPRNRRVEVIVR